MRITLTLAAASAPNSRWAVPGTPTMLRPRRVSNVMLSMELMPLAAPSQLSLVFEMRVPGAEGSRAFLIRIGIDFATAGAMAAECSTLAPKYDNSIASSYDSLGRTNAEGTARGSALITPTTSVQISMTSTSSAAPMIAAE